MGPMGPMGAAGMNGAAGAMGATGPAGPQGVPGSQGPGGGVFGEAASQFAGFTTATFAGNGSGREAMHARCAAAFTGAHLCHMSEYYLSNSATVPPASGAWIDSSGFISAASSTGSLVNGAGDVRLGRIIGASGLNCTSWTASGSLGYMLTVSGVSQQSCTTPRPLACCSTPYAEHFRGFTTQTVSGGRSGGRAEMHQLCGAQFPGSHLCWTAEYARATPTVTPPASGAWIDSSAHLHTSGSLYDTNYLETAELGRYTSGNSLNCTAWTEASPQLGYALTPDGLSQVQCATARPLACCGD
jgi:hypothetical protein